MTLGVAATLVWAAKVMIVVLGNVQNWKHGGYLLVNLISVSKAGPVLVAYRQAANVDQTDENLGPPAVHLCWDTASGPHANITAIFTHNNNHHTIYVT